MLVPNNDELNADAAPFQPHFLQQEMIFAHGHTCLSRASEEITCTKRVCFCLRGISGCECAILPIQEIATCSRCSVCEHGQLRGPLHGAPAPTNFAGNRKSQQDNQPERRKNESDADAVPFLPRFLLQKLIFVHFPRQPRSPIRGNADRLSLR